MRAHRRHGPRRLGRGCASREPNITPKNTKPSERKDYYAQLEQTQKGTLDVTGWLSWFLGTLGRALASAESTLDTVLIKARFWQRWAGTPLNQRQVTLLNRLLDGFEGRLTSSKWAAIAKCSADTALRDITQLLELGLLKKSSGGGRSTGYEVAE